MQSRPLFLLERRGLAMVQQEQRLAGNPQRGAPRVFTERPLEVVVVAYERVRPHAYGGRENQGILQAQRRFGKYLQRKAMHLGRYLLLPERRQCDRVGPHAGVFDRRERR